MPRGGGGSFGNQLGGERYYASLATLPQLRHWQAAVWVCRSSICAGGKSLHLWKQKKPSHNKSFGGKIQHRFLFLQHISVARHLCSGATLEQEDRGALVSLRVISPTSRTVAKKCHQDSLFFLFLTFWNMTFAFNSQLQAEGDVCIQTPSMSLESGIVLRPAVPRPMHFLPFPEQKQKGNAKMKCSRFFHTPSSQSDPIKSALETSDGRTRISFYGAIGSCKTECLQQAELPEEDLSDRISLCSSSRTKVCFPPVFFPTHFDSALR